jgi:hypothetical protein
MVILLQVAQPSIQEQGAGAAEPALEATNTEPAQQPVSVTTLTLVEEMKAQQAFLDGRVEELERQYEALGMSLQWPQQPIEPISKSEAIHAQPAPQTRAACKAASTLQTLHIDRIRRRWHRNSTGWLAFPGSGTT